MDIDVEDINNLTSCDKCGVVFNYVKAHTGIAHETDYARTPIYTYQCPVCKYEDRMWED